MATMVPSAAVAASSPCLPTSAFRGSCLLLARTRFLPSSPRPLRVFALVFDPSDSGVNDFVAHMEKAWVISLQPRPVSCVSCNTEGTTECQWCRGTGFFILGDNMLCEVPSRNTKCLICHGEGLVPCKDCKGTGYIAKWLRDPSSYNKGS